MTSAAVGRSYPSSSRMCGGTRVTNAPRMKYKLKIDAYPAAGDGPRAYAARRRHGIGFGIACAGPRTQTANKKPRSSPPDKAEKEAAKPRRATVGPELPNPHTTPKPRDPQ